MKSFSGGTGKKKKRYFLFVMLLAVVALLIALFRSDPFGPREAGRTDAIRLIKERGKLIALTDKNTLNYFISRGEAAGYQLELLQSFARSLGVSLRIIAIDDIPQLTYYLDHHAADLLALNLPVSREGRRRVHFTRPFGETRLVLVQQKQGPKGVNTGHPFVRDLKEFRKGDTISVPENVFKEPFYEFVYRETDRKVILRRCGETTSEMLIREVAEGRTAYALCPENVVMMYKRFYGSIDASLVVFPLYSYSWAVHRDSDSLLVLLDRWISGMRSSGQLKKTYLDYFDNQKVVNNMRSDYVSLNGKKLSPYDGEIRELSRHIGWDWRLVASVIYEESNFIPGQVSSRSAHGLMQLMPETAVMMGIDSLSTPAQQISAGIRYLKYLDRLLPGEISDQQERVCFILAAYNVGIGRVIAARNKAIKFGKDPNRWNGQVEYYLLRRSAKDPFARADSASDFPVDYTANGFVHSIVERYYHYRNLIPF